MDTNKLSNWLQVAANLGLMAGIVMVAFQINQTSELTKDRLYFDRWAEHFNLGYATLGENPQEAIAKAKTTPEELTHTELEVISNYLNSQLNYWHRIKRTGARGIIDSTDWRAMFDRKHPEYTGLNAIFRYPVAKAFWDTYGVIWSEVDPEFASGVTQAIEELSLPSDLMSDFKANIEKYNNAGN